MTPFPIKDFCVFYRSTDIAPSIPPKPGRPRCYEQMHKFRCQWFVCGKAADGQYAERGPFASYDAARQFAGR